MSLWALLAVLVISLIPTVQDHNISSTTVMLVIFSFVGLFGMWVATIWNKYPEVEEKSNE